VPIYVSDHLSVNGVMNHLYLKRCVAQHRPVVKCVVQSMDRLCTWVFVAYSVVATHYIGNLAYMVIGHINMYVLCTAYCSPVGDALGFRI